MSDVRALADAVAQTILTSDPFTGTALGMREYDGLLPDPSLEAEEKLSAAFASHALTASSLAPETPAERVTLGVVAATCSNRQLSLANRRAEYTVTAMPLAGPPALFSILARATLPDASAVDDYVTRLRGSADWLDGSTARLAAGVAAGRFPVGDLVDQAIAWADRALATPVPSAFTAPAWPDGVSDEAVAPIVIDSIMPAVARWRSALVELRPLARASEQAGMCFVPGGEEAYERDIAVHTTLPLTAAEIHQIGLDTVAELSAKALSLGASIGLLDQPSIVAAVRASSASVDPVAAMDTARAAIARAEAVAGSFMPLPLPSPCAVSEMPVSVAEAGMAPHYTRPQPDGSRPGTFWFNTLRATAGCGWDLESVAFHEAVPGHHSQLARAQALPDLPLLQQMVVTAHAEGWGLYSERLAGEFGLYSSVEAELGAVYLEMARAARLVVDTGLHAFGWSRAKAISYFVSHVALPESFLENEVDRYIAWPGQALAYMIGQREMLRVRSVAQSALGPRFALAEFHSVVLDSGSVPLPVLASMVDEWVAGQTL